MFATSWTIRSASSIAAGTRSSTCHCSCVGMPWGPALPRLHAGGRRQRGVDDLAPERIRARTGSFVLQAIARMTEHPERVATEPTIPAKIVTAAASAAVAALVKKLLESRGVTALANGAPTARPCRLSTPTACTSVAVCSGSPTARSGYRAQEDRYGRRTRQHRQAPPSPDARRFSNRPLGRGPRVRHRGTAHGQIRSGELLWPSGTSSAASSARWWPRYRGFLDYYPGRAGRAGRIATWHMGPNCAASCCSAS